MGRTLLVTLFMVLCFQLFAQKSTSIGIDDNYPPKELSIYPNPTPDFFEIRNVDLGNTQLVLFNLVGREMKRFNIVEDDLRYSIADLPNGLYLVQILDKNRKIISTKRIQKK